MATTFQVSAVRNQPADTVRPSKVDPHTAPPFTLDQELKPFGTWVDAPIWVPPKDASQDMAESMLRQPAWFTPQSKRWVGVVEQHRDSFTQVREIELCKASIRLPKGKLFVSVTEPKQFDTITDPIPDCVRTRLEEFLAGPGKRSGVKVSYLKPLCVEVDDELRFTSREDVLAAIDQIQQEVFSAYHRKLVPRRCDQAVRAILRGGLALPRAFGRFVVERRQRALDAYQAKLEFQRRKTALRAAKNRRKCRTDGCTFDEMLALTNPLQRADVIGQFAFEQKLSRARRDQLLQMSAGHLPWFALVSMGLYYLSTITVTVAPPLAVCDPAFVAEFPDAKGVLMNIGHFDEIAGVRHVEF